MSVQQKIICKHAQYDKKNTNVYKMRLQKKNAQWCN